MTDYPALFLDRDGVININKGYVHKEEDCEFIEGIFNLVKRANQLGYKVIVVTNQAGIARGYYTEDTFLNFSEWMKNEFRNHQALIDEIYFCPHHPEHGVGKYLKNCECRKPAPGMLIQAKQAHNIDMSRSIMVGDSLSDIEAADAANVKYRYLFNWAPLGNNVRENKQAQDSYLNAIKITSLDDVDLPSI